MYWSGRKAVETVCQCHIPLFVDFSTSGVAELSPMKPFYLGFVAPFAKKYEVVFTPYSIHFHPPIGGTYFM